MADYVAGIDIGGTKIVVGIMDAAGNVVARYSCRGHAGRPPDAVVEATLDALEQALAAGSIRHGDVAGIGVGFAGHVWGERGLVLTSSNLVAWDRHPLRDHLAARAGLPVILENDSNCCAWGEYRYGAGRGSRYLCYVTFSTGYGLGIVLDGHLFAGATGTAGEIGHTVVDPDGPLCSCGKRGCVMSYACGMAISRMACERIDRGDATLLRDLAGAGPEEADCHYRVSGEAVAAAALQGDTAAQEIVATAGYYFGIGLSTVVQVINPDRIVIGGSLVKMGPMLMQPCLQALRDNVHPVLRDSAEIAYSELWDDAGMIGAADLAWQKFSA